MRALSVALAASCLAVPAFALPLTSTSDDTLARVCLSRAAAPVRLIEVCDGALATPGLTRSEQASLITARADGNLWLDRFEQSEADYRAAISLDPRSIEAWNGLGWALWEFAGDATAYEAFQTSLSIGVSVQGLSGMAATGRRMGLVANDASREMLRAALAIDPDYIWAVRELAWSYLDDGHASEAQEQFRSALEIEPKDINARFGLGRAHLATGDAEAALGVFNDVMADAADFPTRVYRSIALRQLDRNVQALREADRLIASHPDRSSGYIERGHALIALERRDEALDTFARAEQALGPNNAVLYWYADTLTLDNRFREALAIIERGIALPGADHTDHLLHSYIALELGDLALARKAAEASLAAGVEDPWAHYYIAIALVRGGDAPEAIERFELAIAGGLPAERVGSFATELIDAGKYVEAAQLRLKY
ncbi:MAG: tetratricopeptide repeat protein [Paracoccaceae bacterium]|nr:tetratricopeptide repeat protein [Paracoccaceae bacterium]